MIANIVDASAAAAREADFLNVQKFLRLAVKHFNKRVTDTPTINADTSAEQAREKADTTVLIWKGVIALIVSLVLLAAILFISVGRLSWPMAWVFLGVLAACVCINMVVLVRINPEVIEERLRLKAGAKKWDMILTSVIAVPSLAALVVAGLDERFGWSPAIPLALKIAALAIFVLGDLLFLWAMAVNKFFSKFVRIQRERGHYVVTSGPYQYVRHPGYVVCCHVGKQQNTQVAKKFEFLGYCFRPRLVRSRYGKMFVSFTPAISPRSAKKIRQQVRRWRLHLRTSAVNPAIPGWVNY